MFRDNVLIHWSAYWLVFLMVGLLVRLAPFPLILANARQIEDVLAKYVALNYFGPKPNWRVTNEVGAASVKVEKRRICSSQK